MRKMVYSAFLLCMLFPVCVILSVIFYSGRHRQIHVNIFIPATQCYNYALLNAIIMLNSKGGFKLTNELRNEYPKNMQFINHIVSM